jgi:hypothetical protein
MKNLFLKLGLLPALILVAVVFGSCGDNDPKLPDNTVIAARNVAALSGNTDEIALVRAMAYDWDGDGWTSIAEATFQNNGFTLQLPASLPDNFLRPIAGRFPDNAAITLTGNSNAKWSPVIEFVALCENDNATGSIHLVGGVEIENLTGTAASWVYANSDVSVTGDFQLDGDFLSRIVINLNLRKGWNNVYTTASTENDIFVLTTTTQRPSGFFIWTYISWDNDLPRPLIDFFR